MSIIDKQFEILETKEFEEYVGAIIKVMGVGGCGCNIINDMHTFGLNDAELIGVNTDVQSLGRINANEKIQIGKQLRRGRGSGNKPEIGQKSAEEDRGLIENKLTGTDMLFIVAGLGGGTGSGASPVIAELARSAGILTVAVVITPFKLELNEEKTRIVEESLASLKERADTVITISNEKLFKVFDKNKSIHEAYSEVNRALINIISGIVKMITVTGDQNIDFEDVKTALKEGGNAFIGIGKSGGMDRAKQAYENAIKNPFMDDVNLAGAKIILANYAGNITLNEIKEIENIKAQHDAMAEDKPWVKFGWANDQSMGDEIEVTILIAGINSGIGSLREKEEKKVKGVPLVENINELMADNYSNEKIDIPTYQRVKIQQPASQYKKNKNQQTPVQLN